MTTDVSITRTVKLPLETSTRKNNLVRGGIDAFQAVQSFMADRLPTYPEHEWEPLHTQMYRQSQRGLPEFPDEFPGRGWKSAFATEAQKMVSESFKSWRQKGKPGRRPQFGDGQYLGLKGEDVTIARNDTGWGLQASFISYHPVWFGIVAGEFQREFLERVTDDGATAGRCELHRHDEGRLVAHQTVSWDVPTLETGETSRVVGVDLNVDPLVACAALDDDGDVLAVEMESGAEYRHHRERAKEAKARAMEQGNFRAIKDARRDYWRYTDHITNHVSRQVVDFAVEHTPCQIALEDLTYIRETADDPIHDWPFAEIQEKISYKAQEEGIPVTMVEPRGTSITCSKCGSDATHRDGVDFECECGYEVHADVNAAKNIAKEG